MDWVPENAPVTITTKRYHFDPFDITHCKVVLEGDREDRVMKKLAMLPGVAITLHLSSRSELVGYVRRMVLCVNAWLLRDHNLHSVVTKTVAVKIPKTWWEMLKRDHLPRWWLRRWPVQTKEVTELFTFEQEVRVCPHCNIDWPDRKHLDFMTFEGELRPYPEKT